MKKFFVHIIESPSPKNFLDGDFEGNSLIEGLRITGISSVYHLAVNKESFLEAITIRFHEAIQKYGVPFLHISAHGDKSGIELTDGTYFLWKDLKRILLPINKALNGTLLLNISTCSGFDAFSMEMNFSSESTFYGLVGPTKDIDLADTTIAFVAFYHNFGKGARGAEALEAMKKASGNNNFKMTLAEWVKKNWRDYINQLQRRQIMQELVKTPPLK